MSRINLLPWRAELRKQRQRDFLAMIGLAFSVSLLLMFLWSAQINARKDNQLEHNRYLEKEIADLDTKISEIQELEAKKKALIARMEVIQQLQASRPEIVHLFDELGRTIPEGVYLTDLNQTDKNITVNGMAQSNARVSAYMRNLESSTWLKEPILNIIETRADSRDPRKERSSKFTLQIKQSSQKADAKTKGTS